MPKVKSKTVEIEQTVEIEEEEEGTSLEERWDALADGYDELGLVAQEVLIDVFEAHLGAAQQGLCDVKHAAMVPAPVVA